MAASEPARDDIPWASHTFQSSDPPFDTNSLDIGMAGMSMLSYGAKRKETDSTITSSPPDERESRINRYYIGTQDSVETSGLKGSAPTSPSSEQQHAKGVVRPPGLNVPLPSPIGTGGPGHSKNTSATSPLLTLTPNSSVDGNSDWHSLGTRQSSPFQVVDAPALPFLQNEHRHVGASEDTASFGSFDLNDGDNDGLLGLEALRDRAHSSPGPIQFMTSSPPPPFAKGHFSAHHQEGSHERNQRAARDRPPLSQSYQESIGSYQNDRVGMSFQTNPQGRQDFNFGLDLSDQRGFGAIARPDLRYQAPSEYEMNRQRALSSENLKNSYSMQQNGYPDSLLSAKFGSLPTLHAHIQQQRGSESYADVQKPRHVRSVSQPMPANDTQHVPPGMYPSSSQRDSYPFSGENHYKPRSVASHPVLAATYEGKQLSIKRGSMPNLNGVSVYAQQMQRNNDLDFQFSSQSVSGSDDHRYGTSSMISPGHSPMQIQYANHSRQSSDAAGSILSSSSMSIGGGSSRMYGHVHGIMHHRQSSGGDDDLTHPLVGEQIDFPDHDDIAGARYMNQNLPQLMPRHGQSLSLDQIPPHYLESSHHLPTAGATLSMPKIVYSVKFKRTQRNFALGPRIVRDLKIGTYVKVEADRGEDLGIVVGRVSADKYNLSGRPSFPGGLNAVPGLGGSVDLKRIIRLATHDEVSLLAIKRGEEEDLLKICRSKVRQRGLPMNVVDAEYQFDRHKLTFFFEAEGRVDFRELVRDLFSMYKTRIWMQQLDKSTSSSAPALAAPHPSNLQMDFGTPIIAPVSEFADSIVLGIMSAGDARSH